ncbi:MAG: hypothetical protein MHM6MM_008962, partial [Cercozoa sp. M6MM]
MAEETLKTYTADEVAKHNTEQDCWIILDGKVYDVTKFLDDHPGGADTILDFAGEDSTEAFEEIFHSEKARQQAEEYLIGKLEGGSKKTTKSAGASTSSFLMLALP